MTINYYCKLDTTELGTYVEEISPIGGNAKFTSSCIPLTDRYSMRHDGIEPRGWSLKMSGILDAKEANIDSIIALFKTVSAGDKFYPYRAAKFARILKADAWEGESSHYHQPYWGADAVVYIDPALLFADTSIIWYPTSTEKYAITPAGTVAAPLDELKIIGSYVNGHVTSPIVEVWNAAGTILEDSVLITDMLLTDEICTVDYRCRITQVYTDTFATSTKFSQDATNEGCTIEPDGLVIGALCSAAYKLHGPWPLWKNIVITGTILEGAGNLYLQYSYDNITWRTAISNDDLIESTIWVVPNTKGHGDVYIRFSSYSGGSDSDERTEDTILAELMAVSRNRDNYYKGIWGRTYQASTYAYLVKLATDQYAYQIQQAGDAILTNAWAIGSEYESALALYNASVVVAVTDRTSSQILTDVTTPTPAKDRDTYYKGVWGRVLNANTYMFMIKLDTGKYAYQIHQAGTLVPTNPWAIGTDAQAAAALFAASVVTGDRSDATILANIVSPTPAKDRNVYYKGVWGRTLNAGAYAYVVRLSTNTSTGLVVYAYQIQTTGNAILTNPWAIGSADQTASALYAASTPTALRTTATMQAEINTAAANRNRDTYYNGVWGRTVGSGKYMFMVRLLSNLYAYQLQEGTATTSNPWYVGTRAQAAAAIYAASSGTRTAANIEADILNTVFGNYASSSIYFDIYGYNIAEDLYCRCIIVQNSPLVIAYEGHLYGSTSPTWYIDSAGGPNIIAALVNGYVNPGTRTLANIKSDVVDAGWSDIGTYYYTVDGPYAGKKPLASVVQINNTPQVFAYSIMGAAGTWSDWAIDDQAGYKTYAALQQATVTNRTATDIQNDINAAGFAEPSTYSYTVYGYVNGARPFATIFQVNNTPQKLVYKISLADGTDTAWLLEANAGVDCRDALMAGFSGVSGGRTLADIRADITSAVWAAPTSYDYQVYGLAAGVKPLANIILVNNTPRTYAYQIESLDGASAWGIDDALGAEISAALAALTSSEATVSGNMTLSALTITQERVIPYSEYPVIPLDGLAHGVRILNGPTDTGQWSPSLLKATAVSRGATEVFTATAATGSKVYLQSSLGKYLTSNWGDEYVSCSTLAPGATEEFEIITLGMIGSNHLVAIRCSAGQYLSATTAGAGFVLTDALTIGQAEIFEQIVISAGNFAFRVFSRTASRESMVLDGGELDVATLDGDCAEESSYAGKYLTAVPGTHTGSIAITATYRDRFYI